MGEEPERLRAAKSKLEYLRYGDGNFTPLDSTDAEVLLAEGQSASLSMGREIGWQSRAETAEAECERLVGRVATLEQTLNNGATYGETIAIRTWCSLALADVGGSE